MVEWRTGRYHRWLERVLGWSSSKRARFLGPDVPAGAAIVEPTDGVPNAGIRLSLQGTALPALTVALYRGNVSHRTVQADAAGNWKVSDAELNVGDNVFTARARGRLAWSQPSNPVRVSWVGAEPGLFRPCPRPLMPGWILPCGR